MSNQINNIGVLTSGGDSPGMNAAIRAVVRAARFYKKRAFGIYKGFDGLIDNDIEELDARSVKNILNRGGTILKSSRSSRFMKPEGRRQAFENLKTQGIDALVVIGGNGTFTGAHIFWEEFGMPVMGIPGTIDNDLYGTDFTLGFDSATNVVIECVDRLRDTAESHDRLFFIEVMGRDSGFIALRSALASGAVDVVLPEENAAMEDLIAELKRSVENHKTNKLVIVAEGNKLGDTFSIADHVRQVLPQLESKVTILGHLQRGGAPSCADRVLAGQLGVGAVEALLDGKSDMMVGVVNGKVTLNFLQKTISNRAGLDPEWLRISKILSI